MHFLLIIICIINILYTIFNEENNIIYISAWYILVILAHCGSVVHDVFEYLKYNKFFFLEIRIKRKRTKNGEILLNFTCRFSMRLHCTWC